MMRKLNVRLEMQFSVDCTEEEFNYLTHDCAEKLIEVIEEDAEFQGFKDILIDVHFY